jgi:hypothetical protein
MVEKSEMALAIAELVPPEVKPSFNLDVTLSFFFSSLTFLVGALLPIGRSIGTSSLPLVPSELKSWIGSGSCTFLFFWQMARFVLQCLGDGYECHAVLQVFLGGPINIKR